MSMTGRGYSEDDFGTGGSGSYERGCPPIDDQDDLTAMKRPIPIPTARARVVGTPWDPPVKTYQREISGVEVSVGAKPHGTASEVYLLLYARAYLSLPPHEMRDLAHALLRAADEGESRWPDGYFTSTLEKPVPYTPPTCKSCCRVMKTAKHATGVCRPCRVQAHIDDGSPRGL